MFQDSANLLEYKKYYRFVNPERTWSRQNDSKKAPCLEALNYILYFSCSAIIRELTAHLRQIIKERDHTILSLKNSISRHFDLEVRQQESKGHLLGLVEEINKTDDQVNRNVTLKIQSYE